MMSLDILRLLKISDRPSEFESSVNNTRREIQRHTSLFDELFDRRRQGDVGVDILGRNLRIYFQIRIFESVLLDIPGLDDLLSQLC